MRRGALLRLPARPGPLAGYFLGRALVGGLLSLPLALQVAPLVGSRPAGDAVLWEPGGTMLLEVTRLLEPMLPGLAWSASAVGLAASFALLVPLAALVASLRSSPSGQGPPVGAGRLLTIAAERFGPLALLMGLVMVLQALSLLIGWALTTVLLSSLDLAPSTRDVAGALLLPAAALVPWLVGLVHDVARVVVVRRGLGPVDALAVALHSLRGVLLRAVVACGWRGLAAVAALAASGWLTVVLGCHSRRQLAGAIAVQLAALAVAVVLRASWLRWIAVRLPGASG